MCANFHLVSEIFYIERNDNLWKYSKPSGLKINKIARSVRIRRCFGRARQAASKFLRVEISLYSMGLECEMRPATPTRETVAR